MCMIVSAGGLARARRGGEGTYVVVCEDGVDCVVVVVHLDERGGGEDTEEGC